MAIKSTTINRFDYGINDLIDRDLSNGYFKLVENMEITPRGAKQVANVEVPVTTKDRNVCAIINIGDTAIGLGWENSSGKKVALWDLTTSPEASAVVPGTNYTFAAKTRPFLVSDGTYIYFNNANNIGKIGIALDSPDGDWCTTVPTGGLLGGLMWQGTAWGWSGQFIYSINIGTGVATQMKEIPAGQTIKEILDLGNLLGIVCDGGTVAESKMYIYDGVASSTFNDIVKLGSGYVRGAGILDGVPYVVMNSYNNREIRIKAYTGSIFKTVFNYKGHYNLESTPRNVNAVCRVLVNQGYIYMLVLGTISESTNQSEYFFARYGRKIADFSNAFTIYKTTGVVPTSIAYPTSNCDFVIQNDNSSVDYPIVASLYDTTNTMKVLKNTSPVSYITQPGVLETGIITEDSHIQKSLTGFSVMHSPLVSGASVACMYKVDGGTGWTTFMTSDTDGEVSKECLNIEATATNLDSFKELKLRFELLGGAEITGVITKYEQENSTI